MIIIFYTLLLICLGYYYNSTASIYIAMYLLLYYI